MQDAAREQTRRKTRRLRAAGFYARGQSGWRYRLWESYDAAQGWIVVTIIGVAIGLNAAFLNIVTEWLSDIKMGHCTTAFYLNENFCCWGEDNGTRHACSASMRTFADELKIGCAHWHRWTGFEPLNYLIYMTFAVRRRSFPYPLSDSLN